MKKWKKAIAAILMVSIVLGQISVAKPQEVKASGVAAVSAAFVFLATLFGFTNAPPDMVYKSLEREEEGLYWDSLYLIKKEETEDEYICYYLTGAGLDAMLNFEDVDFNDPYYVHITYESKGVPENVINPELVEALQKRLAAQNMSLGDIDEALRRNGITTMEDIAVALENKDNPNLAAALKEKIKNFFALIKTLQVLIVEAVRDLSGIGSDIVEGHTYSTYFTDEQVAAFEADPVIQYLRYNMPEAHGYYDITYEDCLLISTCDEGYLIKNYLIFEDGNFGRSTLAGEDVCDVNCAYRAEYKYYIDSNTFGYIATNGSTSKYSVDYNYTSKLKYLFSECATDAQVAAFSEYVYNEEVGLRFPYDSEGNILGAVADTTVVQINPENMNPDIVRDFSNPLEFLNSAAEKAQADKDLGVENPTDTSTQLGQLIYTIAGDLEVMKENQQVDFTVIKSSVQSLDENVFDIKGIISGIASTLNGIFASIGTGLIAVIDNLGNDILDSLNNIFIDDVGMSWVERISVSIDNLYENIGTLNGVEEITQGIADDIAEVKEKYLTEEEVDSISQALAAEISPSASNFPDLLRSFMLLVLILLVILYLFLRLLQLIVVIFQVPATTGFLPDGMIQGLNWIKSVQITNWGFHISLWDFLFLLIYILLFFNVIRRIKKFVDSNTTW